MTRRWILDQLGEPTFERLAAELSGSELQSVLLEVMQRRASARSPAEVLAQYQRDPDWLARLTSNRRALYVASGAGAQLIAFRFRVPVPRADGVAD